MATGGLGPRGARGARARCRAASGPGPRSSGWRPPRAAAASVPEPLQGLEPEALGARWEVGSLNPKAQQLPDWEAAATCLGWGSDLEFLLEHCPLSYLATASPVGAPELSLMFFNYVPGDCAVYFNTPKGLKLENILANERVSMLVHNFEGKAATESLFKGVKAQAFTLYGVASIGASAGEDGYDASFRGKGRVEIKLDVDSVLVVNQSGQSFRFNRRTGDGASRST